MKNQAIKEIHLNHRSHVRKIWKKEAEEGNETMLLFFQIFDFNVQWITQNLAKQLR